MNKLSKFEELTIDSIVKYTKDTKNTELSITGHGGTRPNAGRKPSPNPLPVQSIRCTPQELILVKMFIKQLRSVENGK